MQVEYLFTAFRRFVFYCVLIFVFAVVSGCRENLPLGDGTQEIQVNYQSPFENVFIAAAKGSVDDIRYFIDQGVDVNEKSNEDFENQVYTNDSRKIILDINGTPLHYAAHHNPDIEVVKYLIEKGADANAKTDVGVTPPDLAAGHNPNMEILKYLVENGADANLKDGRDWTPLHYAALHNSNVEVLEYLIEKGVDVNTRYGRNWTPLLYAAGDNPNMEILEYLFEKGADVNTVNDKGTSPLHRAAERNRNIDVLKYLLENGANLNAKDEEGRTPFDLANTEKKKAILFAVGGKSGSEL